VKLSETTQGSRLHGQGCSLVLQASLAAHHPEEACPLDGLQGPGRSRTGKSCGHLFSRHGGCCNCRRERHRAQWRNFEAAARHHCRHVLRVLSVPPTQAAISPCSEQRAVTRGAKEKTADAGGAWMWGCDGKQTRRSDCFVSPEADATLPVDVISRMRYV
jgi:hypothetical protein